MKNIIITIMGWSRVAKTAAFAGIAALAIMLSLGVTDARVAYNVNYEGKVIATVSQKRSFSAAVNLLNTMVQGDIEGTVSEPSFSATIVRRSVIDGEDAVANAIIQNSRDIIEAATLIINGQEIAVVDANRLELMLEERKNAFTVEGADCAYRFIDDVKVEKGYFLLSDIHDISVVEDIIKALSVETSYRATADKSVAYKTVTKKTNEKVKGYTKVTTKGVNGVTRVTEDIVLLNGAEQSRTLVTSEVISEPVNEVVVVGNAKSVASAETAVAVSKLGLSFPLPAGTWKVSAYWGDGRNHKGVDLSAPKNTAIMAAGAGKVTRAGWYGDYGYCVIIDHGNGYSTLYGHANKVCVSVGQTVAQGDVVALVGTTGYSTGNHLHFEVRKGNTRINPAPFIGL